MTPPPPPGSGRRARRVALLLAAGALLAAAGGGLLFVRFASRVASDPGFAYRNQATFEMILKQARAAEERGDRGGAIADYRFIVAVGARGDSVLQRYIEAARAGLEQMGAERQP